MPILVSAIIIAIAGFGTFNTATGCHPKTIKKLVATQERIRTLHEGTVKKAQNLHPDVPTHPRTVEPRKATENLSCPILLIGLKKIWKICQKDWLQSKLIMDCG